MCSAKSKSTKNLRVFPVVHFRRTCFFDNPTMAGLCHSRASGGLLMPQSTAGDRFLMRERRLMSVELVHCWIPLGKVCTSFYRFLVCFRTLLQLSHSLTFSTFLDPSFDCCLWGHPPFRWGWFLPRLLVALPAGEFFYVGFSPGALVSNVPSLIV